MARFTDTCFNIIVKNSTSEATTGCVGAAIAAQSLSEAAAVLASSYIPQLQTDGLGHGRMSPESASRSAGGAFISLYFSAQSDWAAASSVA